MVDDSPDEMWNVDWLEFMRSLMHQAVGSKDWSAVRELRCVTDDQISIEFSCDGELKRLDVHRTREPKRTVQFQVFFEDTEELSRTLAEADVDTSRLKEVLKEIVIGMRGASAGKQVFWGPKPMPGQSD